MTEEGQRNFTQPGLYQHFKGAHYLVLGEARVGEACFVVYVRLVDDAELILRPRTEFHERVGVSIQHGSAQRFRLIKPMSRRTVLAYLYTSACAMEDKPASQMIWDAVGHE